MEERGTGRGDGAWRTICTTGTIKKLNAESGKLKAPLTVAVQGFGNVGYNMVKFWWRRVLLSSPFRTVRAGYMCQEGVNPELTMECKKKKRVPGRMLLQRISLRSERRRPISNDELLELPVDILIPSALEGVLN